VGCSVHHLTFRPIPWLNTLVFHAPSPLQISGVQKATAKLIEGLELAVARGRGGGSAFNVHFLTIIPYFKVTEVCMVAKGSWSFPAQSVPMCLA
jgi:hypothetical protein